MASESTIPTSTEFMKRALLTNVAEFGVASKTGVANMVSGGQNGTGIRFTDIDAASPLVFNPALVVVTHAPAFWNMYPRLQEMLKSLVETHARSITGIDFGYQMQTADNAMGNDGQTFKTPTRSIRTDVSPSIEMMELSGNLIWNLIRMWIWDMQHPDTNASKLSAQMASGSDIPAWLMSAYSMSMVVIQFDPTGLPDRIIDAAFYTNMFPTDTGELGLQRVLGTTETKTRTIPFTGVVQHNENTRELGYQIAKMLNIHRINYDFALPGLSGKTMPNEGAITKAINDLGLYNEALGTELPAVTAYKPLGTDTYAERIGSGTGLEGGMTTPSQSILHG